MPNRETTSERAPARGTLIPPVGGRLVDLLERGEGREALLRRIVELPSVRLSERSTYDLELLAAGGFGPLDRFMGRDDVERVVEEMRLADGTFFPLPVVLPVDDDAELPPGGEVVLRDRRNEPLAVMQVDEVFEWDRRAVAAGVLGTTDERHPLVAEMAGWGGRLASGPLRVVRLPRRFDFAELRLSPAETRERLSRLGRPSVVAFQTRNPLHRVHEEMTRRAVAETNGTLLLHPVVGLTRPGDVDHYTRVRTYLALADRYYEPDRTVLALLPLAMWMAGPREALLHALVRRNYGADHLIVGRDHASPGEDSAGRPFYPPYAAQELIGAHEHELGVRVVPFRELVYLPDEDRYEEADRVGDRRTATLSGSRIREDLRDGRPLPAWYTRPEVAEILAEAHPARHRQGVCLWFTGLSGAGKSTTAEIVTVLLQERGRQATLLDGDVVRTHLSRGLGFSKEDRDRNVRRIGFVAAEIVRHGGVAVCAAVSPYRAARNDVRSMVGGDHFVEVFVDTPLAVCEARDAKGMYARARRGEIEGFTGIDDPYERPEDPEITIETVASSAEQNARRIVDLLVERGFVRPREAS